MRRSIPVIGRSRCGITHGGVRWKRSRCSTTGWICGTTWIAEAPVPTTATRRPVRSWSWFQSAVWNVTPSKVSRPGMSGIAGSLRKPGAAIRRSAVNGPCVVSTCQTPRSSSHCAPVIVQSKWMRSRTPKRSDTSRR